MRSLRPKNIQTIYLILLLGNTLAASFIWGINTIFLLDAGLSNVEAFSANAFFTLGQVIFEVPTGIVADTLGRRTSYLLGAFTLMTTTLLYLMLWYIKGPFWSWALVSMFLGLGFTFFSGAVEAWLVDALKATKFKGSLESVFAKGQIVNGIAMLVGSVSGGFIAQATNLGIPYIIRSAILVINLALAFFLMKDLGFTPKRTLKIVENVKQVFVLSIKHGLGNRHVRWLMLAAPFSFGVSFYVFYALQPYLLELYGNNKAYGIAGLIAAIVAGSQIAGGLLAPLVRRLAKRRTSLILSGIILSAVLLFLVAILNSFALTILLVSLWGLVSAAVLPIRQAYLNSLIPTEQRATVLSFDSLMGSSGGIVIQPVLGKVADVWSYGTSFMIASLFQLMAAPFIFRVRQQFTKEDIIHSKTNKV